MRDFRMLVAVVDEIFAARFGALAGMALLLMAADLPAEDAVYRFTQVQVVRGPCCGDVGSDLVVDDNDSVLVAGRRGGLDLDRDGTVDLDTYGTPDALVFMSHDGNMSGWVQGPGGPKEDFAAGIASDGQGGVYAAGMFTDTLVVGDGSVAGAGKSDGFLIRFDPDGQPLWTVAIGGEQSDRLHDVSSDADGNAYISGIVRGPVDLDRDGDADIAPSSTDTLLIASFDPEGQLRWSRTFQGDARVLISTILADSGGAVYVGGSYLNGALDADGNGAPELPEAIANPAAKALGDFDINAFYARLDTAGNVEWLNPVSGPGSQFVGAFAVAENGDLVVLGAYSRDADFDADGEPDLEWKSLGEEQIWEYGQDVNSFLLWVSPAGERRSARRYAAGASHVAAYQDQLLLGGSYSGALDLDDDGNPERLSDADKWEEGFIAVLDGTGAIRQVFTVVGGDSDAVHAVGATSDGSKLYATGYTKLGADFDGDGEIESASKCHQLGDVYLALYELESDETSL